MSPDWSAKVEPVPYAKLGDPQTLNLYAYLGDNPLSGVDATGHGWWKNFRQRVGNFFTGHGWNTNAERHKITTTVTTTTMGGVVVNGKTYQTYQKTNPDTGKVYSGRTSSTNSPEENVRMRDLNHHMNEEGYGPAKLDKSSTNSDAIRGREQQLIKQNGGAQSEGGTSGNAINGVNPKNPKAGQYKGASEGEFGSTEEPIIPEDPEIPIEIP